MRAALVLIALVACGGDDHRLSTRPGQRVAAGLAAVTDVAPAITRSCDGLGDARIPRGVGRVAG
jgi:hypothetical protein